MEFDVKISNVLHIKQAEIKLETGKITAVRGANATGKTSTALVVGALLAGVANPLAVGRGQGRIYLRDGADAGHAELSIDGSPIRRWDVKADELTTFVGSTAPDEVSEGALGLIDFTAAMTAPVRTALWESYFLPLPSKLHDMIAERLHNLVSEKVFKAIMEEIREGKIDDISRSYLERARRAKSDWMKATGENWGKAKGADWLPDGWLSELDAETSDTMVTKVQEARDQLHIMHRDQAISAAEIARAAEAAEKLPALQQTFDEVSAELASADEQIAGLEAARLPLAELATVAREELKMVRREEPDEAPEQTLTCPGCSASLVMHAGELRFYDEEAALAVRAEWKTKLDEACQVNDMAARSLAEADKRVAAAKTANIPLQDRLDALRAEIAALKHHAALASAQPTESNADEVEAQEALIERLVKQHEMVLAREAAGVHHRNILDYSEIATQLGPKGVRSTALQAEMTRLDNTLATIASVSGWPRVSVDQTYAIGIGNRMVLRVCAESERLRAQFSLQIGLARCKREPVVILDQVDHLDQEHTAALFSLLSTISTREGAPAMMVCGTELDTALYNPDGINYRLDDGVLIPDAG